MSKAARQTASLATLGVVRRPGTGPGTAEARERSGDITDRLSGTVLPVAAPEPPPPPLTPAPSASPSAPVPPVQVAPPPPAPAFEPQARPEEIVVYWERLRRGRPFPPLNDIDRGLVAGCWPDSLIVAFDGGDTTMPRISRLGATDGAIEYTPMVTDWILTRARHAARGATKLDEVKSFPIEGDTPRYRMLMLPLGMSNGASDCVLCHLCRA